MPVYDSIVIGAGHNGLACACYLAQAGLNVLVLEKRPVLGGAVASEEIFKGYQVDVGASVHMILPSTPIMEELGLAGHGLEYIEMDPWGYFPILRSDQGITFYRSIEQTCASIEKISRRDAFVYDAFMEKWMNFNEGVLDGMLKPPGPVGLGASMAWPQILDYKNWRRKNIPDLARQTMSSYGRLVEESFESEPLRAALMWLAAHTGPGPDELGSGNLAGVLAMIHKNGAWRPKGGSGSLASALVKALKGFGGNVLTEAEVRKINSAGKAPAGPRFTVQTNQGEFHARSIVSACHAQTTLLRLMDKELAGADLQRRAGNMRVGNGFGLMVRHAVSELPQYAGQAANAQGISEAHSAMQLLCPNRQVLRQAFADSASGRPAGYPAVVAMTFSAIDPSIAPPGGHSLYTWAQYYPYELAEGGNWDAIAEQEADKIYEVLCQYAPNMRDKCLARYIQTPLELERRLGLLRGNVMHLDMSVDQLFGFRPLPELSNYRTPVEGLYLSGASTHPGGGVTGASGRNSAQVVLQDFRRRKL
jgi:phytoene dehydrogenase-like protein